MPEYLKKFVKWLATSKPLTLPRKIMGKVLYYAIASKNGVVVYYNTPKKLKILDIANKIKNETDTLFTDDSCNEIYQIFTTVKNTVKIGGDLAEVGVYKGASAKIICEAKGNRTLHLFDTFEGLPSINEKYDDPKQLSNWRFESTTLEDVKNFLKEYPSVFFYKGLFPNTAGPVKDKKFSFVNLDVDIYESTLNCLKFFYPRMNKGGAIISHDYAYGAKGVTKAFDDFFKDKPEPIIELSGSQCLIIKC